MREVVESRASNLAGAPPLFLRISATDWTEGGWDIEQSVELSRRLKTAGVDLIDCSSGGRPAGQDPAGPGFQVPFAERIRREAGIATAAVGPITAQAEADQLIRNGQADLCAVSSRDAPRPLLAFACRTASWATPSPGRSMCAGRSGPPEARPAGDFPALRDASPGDFGLDHLAALIFRTFRSGYGCEPPGGIPVFPNG